jgi:hypothetical protein
VVEDVMDGCDVDDDDDDGDDDDDDDIEGEKFHKSTDVSTETAFKISFRISGS